MDQNFSHLGPILYIFSIRSPVDKWFVVILNQEYLHQMSRSQQASFLNHCPETIFPLCLICFILHPWNACLINVQFLPPPYFQKRVCETNKQLYISSQACYWQPSTCPFYLRHHLICTGINITWSKNVELVAKYIIHIWFVQFVLISTERQTAVCFLVCQ